MKKLGMQQGKKIVDMAGFQMRILFVIKKYIKRAWIMYEGGGVPGSQKYVPEFVP